jgi:broad specificity phosphatase PhoE
VSTHLFLIRHGETDHNRRGLALGRADVPLNDLGRSQARCLAAALETEPLSAVYASPLVRTVETASPIASAHGLELQIEPGLIEMDIGEMDGLTFAEVRERYPRLLDTWTSEEGPAQPVPGGESLLDVQRRAIQALNAIIDRHPEASVCVVSHNFVLLSVLCHFLGAGLSTFRRLHHSVAGITTVEVRDGGKPRITRLNDTCHLDGLR